LSWVRVPSSTPNSIAYEKRSAVFVRWKAFLQDHFTASDFHGVMSQVEALVGCGDRVGPIPPAGRSCEPAARTWKSETRLWRCPRARRASDLQHCAMGLNRRSINSTAIAWFQHLMSRAQDGSRGALLAEDMGLGKTLQLLSVLGGTASELPQLRCPSSSLPKACFRTG
jgi:SNF2-related domain